MQLQKQYWKRQKPKSPLQSVSASLASQEAATLASEEADEAANELAAARGILNSLNYTATEEQVNTALAALATG